MQYEKDPRRYRVTFGLAYPTDSFGFSVLTPRNRSMSMRIYVMPMMQSVQCVQVDLLSLNGS